jgi:hypothetical protein
MLEAERTRSAAVAQDLASGVQADIRRSIDRVTSAAQRMLHDV